MTQEELLNVERKLEGIAPEGWFFEPNCWDTASVRLGPKTVARFTVLLDNDTETDEECRHADECAELAHAQAELVAVGLGAWEGLVWADSATGMKGGGRDPIPPSR